jgi:nucleoside-diphosphate-sugar epimerase
LVGGTSYPSRQLVALQNPLPLTSFIHLLHPPGLGYTGLAAANYFKQKGFKVAGTCTSPEKEHILRLRGFTDTFLFDPDNDLFLKSNQDPSPSSSPALSALLSSNYVLSTIPPSLSAISFPPDDNIITNINTIATTLTTSSILANIDPVLAVHTSDLSRHQNLHWVGYISSTSVYGDYDGDWVDESSPLKCISQKGVARAYAEQAWLNVLPLGGGGNEGSVNIFRCGGIYGPSRSALDIFKRQQQKQEQEEKTARTDRYNTTTKSSRSSEQKRSRQRYTSRVHVLDICRCIEASIAKQQESGRGDGGASIYNVVDDDPSPRREVVAFARHLLLGTELPNTRSSYDNSDRNTTTNNNNNNDDDDDDQRGEWKGSMEEKRVSNRLMKEKLGMKLEFPTYRQGLTALATGDTRPY